MSRRRRLVDRPTTPPAAPVVAAPRAAVIAALHLADHDHHRLRLVPAPGAVGGVAVLVSNRGRGGAR